MCLKCSRNVTSLDLFIQAWGWHMKLPLHLREWRACLKRARDTASKYSKKWLSTTQHCRQTAHTTMRHTGVTVYTEVIVSIKAATAVTNGLVPPHCFTLYSCPTEPWLIEMRLILSSALDGEMVFHKPVFPSGVCIRGANRNPKILNHHTGQIRVINK